MNTTSQSENRDDVLVYRSSERRAGIEKRAGELVKNNDLHEAAEMLEKSQSLEDAIHIGELGWCAAASVAIATIDIVPCE
jgi:hypothetical protein